MIDIRAYMRELVGTLKTVFENRLLYVGLQGSYLRAEATEKSDIDVMVVIDEMKPNDLKEYKKVLKEIGNYDKSCGFICGSKELLNWNPQEICHLLNTTADYYGTLEDFVPKYNRRDIADYIKLSTGNLYHMLCHRYVYDDIEKNKMKLPLIYKDIFYILENVYYLENGEFIQTKSKMEPILCGSDRKIWMLLNEITNEKEYEFDSAFEIVFDWCCEILERVNRYE